MNEVRDIVNKLNEKLFTEAVDESVHENPYYTYLEYTETPIGDYIKYMGHYIWDSENDYRKWVDDENQESMDGFLIAEIVKIKQSIIDSLNILDTKHKAINNLMQQRPSGEQLRESLKQRIKELNNET